MTGSGLGRGLAVLALIVVLFASCVGTVESPAPSNSIEPGQSAPAASGPPASDPTASPSELPPMVSTQPTAPPTTPPATPSPTPLVEPAPGSLDTVAVVEKDGVRVRIELERNPMPAGEWTWVKTTVRNVGRTDLTWFHDGCATLVSVYGEMPAVEWRRGVAQEGVNREFKDRVLDLKYDDDPQWSPYFSFVPKRHADGGQYGCGDIGMSDTIRPGEALRRNRVWNGSANPHWGPPPSGPARLRGRFAYYWRGEEPDEILDQTIEVELDAWVSGGVDDGWLSPAEVVDAALADPEFTSFLATQNLGSGRDEILWYRPDLGAWEVGVLVWYERPDPFVHLVLVDPRTGAIVDRVERPWDRERDGFP